MSTETNKVAEKATAKPAHKPEFKKDGSKPEFKKDGARPAHKPDFKRNDSPRVEAAPVVEVNFDDVKVAKAATSKDVISSKKLLEAGVYFGHRKAKWNPKMKPYILPQDKKGTHIIDIKKSAYALNFAYNMVLQYAEHGATFVFVGTRKQAKKAIKDNALRTNSHYVSERWLGGTLTNSKTIFERVRRMMDLEKLEEQKFAGYTKKEAVLMAKELEKLQKNLSGIKNMKMKPNIMIVADPTHDDIAVKEARKLGVKVIAIVDTNADPDLVDIAIPANDDSIKSVTLIITALADAIVAAKGGKQLFAFAKDEDIVLPEELKEEKKRRFPPRDGRPGQDRFERRPRPAAAAGEAPKAPRAEATTTEAAKPAAPKGE